MSNLILIIKTCEDIARHEEFLVDYVLYILFSQST